VITSVLGAKALGPFMECITVELPTLGVSLSIQGSQLFQGRMQMVFSCQAFKIVADQLVQALAHAFGYLARFLDDVIVNRESDVHKTYPCISAW